VKIRALRANNQLPKLPRYGRAERKATTDTIARRSLHLGGRLMLYQQQNRARLLLLSGNAGTAPLRPASPSAHVAPLARPRRIGHRAEDAAAVKTNCCMPRVGHFWVDQETVAGCNNVDLTCTLRTDETPRASTEKLPVMGSKAYSAAQQEQGTKSVSQRPRAVSNDASSVKSHRRGSL
jgi:hypothetical protein